MLNNSQLQEKNIQANDKSLNNESPYNKSDAKSNARDILLSNHQGSLATITRENQALSGYPMGSVIPFILDNDGCIIMLISDIAEHTKNLNHNSKSSILISDTNASDVQSTWRLTVVGDTRKIIDEKDTEMVSSRYYNFYPQSLNYHKVHDFNFYRMSAIKYRIIMDFGKISWVDNQDFFACSPFDRDIENSMLNHMNDDHVCAMYHYLDLSKVKTDQNKSIKMIAINQYGCCLRHQKSNYFIKFKNTCSDISEVRKELVRLAKL